MTRRSRSRLASALVGLVLMTTVVPPTSASAAPVVLAPNDVMVTGSVLGPGHVRWSAGDTAALVMQEDGNLAVWRGGKALWSSRTGGNPGARAIMRPDGNLVVQLGTKVLWQSGTPGWNRAQAVIQPDGHLVVRAVNGYPVWWRDKGTSAAACAGVSPDPKGTLVSRWSPIVLCVLSALQQSPTHLPGVLTMIQYESSGRPDAINLWDSNAQKGTPSKGLIQVIQPTFDRYRAPELSADLFNPAANLYAGLNYALHRYGALDKVPGLVSLRNGGAYRGY